MILKLASGVSECVSLLKDLQTMDKHIDNCTFMQLLAAGMGLVKQVYHSAHSNALLLVPEAVLVKQDTAHS